ncbi:nitrite reductase large subunit NirB [Parvularcula sp. LCG005]|uniref:nitrite reductase large subunit NirB n=1 Tax=Parvularcula sp. LCG005 TaxID=3078805 RepID=UPI002942C4E0|nr:nitrite reductase large subunit NirB [Parvularcula sp. LCG005]WOI52202.1 nitrite reductase large subunit NirB [Parvularcula sp. LCG005]
MSQSTPKKRLVIIGNGMAPGRMLDHLFGEEPDAFDVTIFNAEPRVNYDRIMLSPVLSGEKRYEDIIIHNDDWYTDHGITLHRGKRVEKIDRAAKRVTALDGTTADYDALVIATGSSPFIIPVPGHDLPGVLTYRDLDDVEQMLKIAEGGGHAVVIGGGLLGLEAAAGLKMQGMEVTVVHLAPTLMERQLDEAAGHLLKQELLRRGINVMTGANTKEILGTEEVGGVRLEDGTVIPARMVCMAVGIRPSAGLAKEAGLDVERGIVVDDNMRTSDPSIFALGECAQHRGQCYGLVAPLYEMAKVVAAQLCRRCDQSYGGSVTATKLKVTGVDLYSAGDFAEGEGREEIVFRDAAKGVYKRLVLEDNRIVGAVMYGDTGDGPWFFQQLKDKADISDMRDTLIFGPAFAGGAALDPMAAVAALPDEMEICGCNGVCKGQITGAIVKKGLSSVDDVRAHTKASASCGTCTGLVEQLLAMTLGDAFDASAVKPVCGCTDFGHDEVRRVIVAQELKSMQAVMQALEWKTSCGCAKCRPALNYYLLCAWPGEYVDDGQSRFINERVHANIQKDGTYSVVPRMWGGMTTAAELRAIADVVDKYQIPTVKCTGGSRIDMLGVKKEDLPSVWADLNAAGLVSGHAYAKGLRTVKSCVGTDWCRFGTQDSTGLAVKLEKFLWGSWTPHKVKLGVSGCPRNCAEATCKDIGVVCVDSGYEIHFAGAAGMHVKGTEVLCTVGTEEEAIEYIGALMQMYREQAWYLDRLYKWADKVGLDYIRDTLMNDGDARRGYFDRFVYSQQFMQTDPWAERAAGKDAHEFTALEPALRLEVV